MCQICAEFRPFETECGYQPIYALISEGADAAANTSTTYTINVDDSFSGNLSFLGDRDWVRVTLTAGEIYDIALAASGAGAGTLRDPYLRIYNSSGTEVAVNDDGGSDLDSYIEFTATYTGVYYLAAGAFNDAGGGTYRLSITDRNIDGVQNLADRATVQDMSNYLRYGYWTDARYNNHNYASGTITVNLTGLTAEGQQLARWAMESWEMVANLNFVETTGTAQITFQDHEANAWALNSWIGAATQTSTVNISTNWLSSYGTLAGSYGFATYLHEIGHALGLGHQGNYNGGATFGPDHMFDLDSWQMSVMSYFDQTQNPNTNASWGHYVTPMMADLLAIQQMYGAAGAGSVTAGATVWGSGSTIDNYLGQLFRVLIDGESGAGFYSGEAFVFTIYDQGGIDLLDLSPSAAASRIDLTPGSFSDIGGRVGNMAIFFDTVIENVRAGSGADHVTGNAAANLVHANGGNDTVEAGAGNDTVYGGEGNDRMLGGTDADRLYGDIGNDTLYGGDQDDRVWGGSNNDRVFGDGGNDWVYGGFGIDRVFGGAGDDRVYGDASSDRVYGDAGNDILYGGTGNDRLFGGQNNDTLFGGDGNDTLTGGAGTDVMFGGAGADVFMFNTRLDSPTLRARDTIQDFESGIDRIDLRGLPGDLTFVASASGLAGQVWYVSATSRLFVDLNGDNIGDLVVQLRSGATLLETDLLL